MDINVGINEKIVTGRKFRRLIDKDSKLWQLISWWTKARDVEFDDGKTAEQKLGNINGITSDTDNESDDIASSISAVHGVLEEMHYRINHFRIYKDESGDIFIIDENEGADAVPKKLGDVDSETLSKNGSYMFPEDTSHAYVLIHGVNGASKDQDDSDKVEHYAEKASTITVKTVNGFSKTLHLSSGSFTDSNTNFKASTINVKYGRAAGIGDNSAWISQLFLFKNIPAGTTIKKSNDNSTMIVFR